MRHAIIQSADQSWTSPNLFFENWFQPVNWSLIRLTAQERTLENGKTPVERQRSHGTH
jgi:hypothetical protein